MTDEHCLGIAEDYLAAHDIGHLRPGFVGRKEDGRWEAIFLVPETADPGIAVVDPPDVRVWVSIFDSSVE